MNRVRALFKTNARVLMLGGMLALFLILIPQQASASWFTCITSPADCFIGSIVQGVSFIVSTIIASVFGLVVAVEAWAVSVLLEISQHIADDPLVQSGVKVTTYIANLGFVLGIVVMAIMTILRRESYGMKQMMAKLIFAAILVNFSIVIAGTILNFSDQLTGAFLASVDPMGEDISTKAPTGGYVSFTTALAGAFAPQKFFIELGDDWPSAGAFGEQLGEYLAPLASVLFTIFALLFIIITLGALIVMLLIRYVYISILMIMMPLAWAAWIFPSLSKHFDDWWGKFFKQVIFAPVVVFFLWLTIKTAEEMGSREVGLSTATIQGSNPLGNAIGGFLTPIITNLLQVTVLCGITLGGLFAAQKLGIEGSKAAFKAAGGIGTGIAMGVGKGIRQKGGMWAARNATKDYKPPEARTGVGRFFQKYAGGAYRGIAQRAVSKMPQDARSALTAYVTKKPDSFGKIIFDSVGKKSGLWGEKKKIKVPKDPDERAKFLEKLDFKSDEQARESGSFDYSDVDKDKGEAEKSQPKRQAGFTAKH